MLLALLAAAWLSIRLVPLPSALLTSQPAGTEYLDRTGRPLRTLPGGDELFRRRVAYHEIPQPLVQATLAAEDRRFWEHPGVDLRGTTRAAWQLIKNRRIVSGGSTITQQLIKLSEPRKRTFRSKLIEAVQAIRLEQVWTKQQILAAYLNRIEYGNGVAGCALAARYYFGKSLHDLSPAESALLAGLPQAPTRLNPLAHFDRAQKRQFWILDQMRTLNWLDSKEYERAKLERLVFPTDRRAFEAPHFVDLLMHHPEGLRSGTIRTSLDLAVNQHAEQVLRKQLEKLRQHDAGNGALVIISNRTGEVIALVGSESYFNPLGGQVNGAWATRSPGSALKPFTFMLAFERGSAPATIFADVPTDFPTATGVFSPVNFDRKWYGPVSSRAALANSLNMPAIKALANSGGPSALLKRLQDWGLTTLTRAPDDYGLGLTLGNAEVRLLELANAYAHLARLGERLPYRFTPPHAPLKSSPGTAPGIAYLIADILSDNDSRATAFGAESNLRFPFKVACKTGTSSNFRDNWAFGYTPEFTVGVWVGNFDGRPMRDISGVTGAAPVLQDLFTFLHQRYGTSWYDRPTNVGSAVTHRLTGKRLLASSHANISDRIEELFLLESPAHEEGPADYDSAGRVILSSEYRQWAESSDNYLGNRIVVEASNSFRILFPLPGTVIYLEPDAPHARTIIRLRAEGANPVQWSSATLRCSQEQGAAIAELVPGRHELKCVDSLNGRILTTWIRVVPN
jgi:penicillin-binding protein 1C